MWNFVGKWQWEICWRALTCYFLLQFSKQMKWTSDHDIIFLCELLLFKQWIYKYGSKKLGKRISESHNQPADIFQSYKRSVQDHYQTLKKTYKNINGKKTGKVELIQKRQKLELLWQLQYNSLKKLKNTPRCQWKAEEKNSKTQQKQKTCKENNQRSLVKQWNEKKIERSILPSKYLFISLKYGLFLTSNHWIVGTSSSCKTLLSWKLNYSCSYSN